MRLALLALVAAVAGCAEFPQIGSAVDPEADALPYPALVPLDPLLSQAGQPAGNGSAEELAARAAALRAQSNSMQSGS